MRKIGLFHFLLGLEWSPADTPAVFGVLPMILGSLYVTAGTILIGVPVGVLARFEEVRGETFGRDEVPGQRQGGASDVL